MEQPGRQAWDRHWDELDGERSLFGMLSGAVRRHIFHPAVEYYSARFFNLSGPHVEMGCGTTESSPPEKGGVGPRIGLDFSLVALREAKRLGHLENFVAGDILNLPFQSGSLAGVWNLGVMEHLSDTQLERCLAEFNRVLGPAGSVILFWPPAFNASRWVLAPIEYLRTKLSGRPFTFFPDEINRLRSRAHARRVLQRAGLRVVAIDFNYRTAFIHMVVVAEKAVAEGAG